MSDPNPWITSETPKYSSSSTLLSCSWTWAGHSRCFQSIPSIQTCSITIIEVIQIINTHLEALLWGIWFLLIRGKLLNLVFYDSCIPVQILLCHHAFACIRIINPQSIAWITALTRFHNQFSKLGFICFYSNSVTLHLKYMELISTIMFLVKIRASLMFGSLNFIKNWER